jgi:hypothetical protein
MACMYVELRPVNVRPDGLSEDVYDTVSIGANCTSWTFQAEIYAPGSTAPITSGVSAVFQSYNSSTGISTILISIVGQTLLPAGEWTGNLWRTDTGFRTDNLNFMMEVVQYPSTQGG